MKRVRRTASERAEARRLNRKHLEASPQWVEAQIKTLEMGLGQGGEVRRARRLGRIEFLKRRLLELREAYGGDPQFNLGGIRVVNGVEAAFVRAAIGKGYSVAKRGWPDFLCWKDGSVMCVEVKPPGKTIKPGQAVVMEVLARAGVKCYLWCPDKGLVRFPAGGADE